MAQAESHAVRSLKYLSTLVAELTSTDARDRMKAKKEVRRLVKIGQQIDNAGYTPTPWVIVENPGTDFEDVWADYESYAVAVKALKNAPEGCDLMKRLADGSLTTEY